MELAAVFRNGSELETGGHGVSENKVLLWYRKAVRGHIHNSLALKLGRFRGEFLVFELVRMNEFQHRIAEQKRIFWRVAHSFWRRINQVRGAPFFRILWRVARPIASV